MADIYIGTSGYDYPEWRGILYPENMSRDGFLACYAEQFNALEINYTYYSMPDERHMSAMLKRGNGKVHFSVKAHGSLTHEVKVSAWRENAALFRQALSPLVRENKLLSVLLQFPQSFHYAEDERRYLDSLVRELSSLPLTVEFRHASWQNERVYEGLRERNIGWCVTDMPELSKLPSRKPVKTAAASYLRFHGRNKASWYGTNARDRYDYLYTDAELESTVPMIQAIAGQSKLVQIYFNNHAKGQAVVNARKMKLILSL